MAASFSVQYIFDLIDRFSPNAGRMAGAAQRIDQTMKQAGTAANAMAAASQKLGGAVNAATAAVTRAPPALAGYANAAQNAAHRVAAAARMMQRDQAFMAAGFRRGGDGNWIGGIPPASPSAFNKGMGMFAMSGLMSYFMGAGRELLNVNREFQEEFNNARAVMAKSTEEDFAAMKASVIDLSKGTVFSATKIMEAMGELGSAGYEAREAMEVLPSALILAQGGREPLDKTAQMLIAIKNQYGLKTGDLGHVTDVLAETSRQTLTKLPELRESFKMLGPFAQIAGLDLETSSGILGVLSQKGLLGSLSGTGARRAATAFLKNAKPMQKFLKKYKIDPNQIYDKKTGKIKDFVGLVEMLEKKGIKAGDAMSALGDRGGPILAALLETGSKELRRLIGDLRNAEGAAQKMADEQTKGLPGALKKLEASVAALRLKIGEAGFESDMTQLAGLTRLLVNGFAELPDPILRAVGWFGMLAGALAAVAIPAALLAFTISTLMPSLTGLAALAAMGKIALTIAVVATGVAAAQWIYDNWDKLKAYASEEVKFNIVFPDAPEWLKSFMADHERTEEVLAGKRVNTTPPARWGRWISDSMFGTSYGAQAEQAEKYWNGIAAANTAAMPRPEDHWTGFSASARPGLDAGAVPAAAAERIMIESSVKTSIDPVQVNLSTNQIEVRYNGPIGGPASIGVSAPNTRGQSTVEAGQPASAGGR